MICRLVDGSIVPLVAVEEEEDEKRRRRDGDHAGTPLATRKQEITRSAEMLSRGRFQRELDDGIGGRARAGCSV